MSDSRPPIIGPSTGPQSPYPLRMKGKVIKGFRRGSSDLGIPTANLPVDHNQTPWIADIESGAYFGWASLLRQPSSDTGASASPNDGETAISSSSTSASASSFPSTHPNSESKLKPTIYPMVMSIGYNPFYGNAIRSAEVHLLHDFVSGSPDFYFYGAEMRVLIMGFIREERDYPTLQALIEDIKMDIDVARRSLEREAWSLRETGKGTLDGSWLVREIVEENEGGDVEGSVNIAVNQLT